jgi:hypothetical protein
MAAARSPLSPSPSPALSLALALKQRAAGAAGEGTAAPLAYNPSRYGEAAASPRV